MTTAERRDAMMEILSERGHETTSNFAKRFGVSRKQIQKDLSKLSMSYPIYTVQGKGGGIFVMEGFKFCKLRLSEEQTDVLRKALAFLSGTDQEVMKEIITLYGRR